MFQQNSLKAIFSSLLFLLVNTAIAQYVAGNTYFDATGYVEYRAGNLPVIISVPHGGDLEPVTIPDRSFGSLIKDSWTKTIGEGLYDAFYEQTGCYPHLIINLLHRKKFDANREIGEAADGNPTVEEAWYGYHEFIDSSKMQITEDYGRGIFLDIHGHAHTIQRIELGYLLSGSELRLSDATLNTNTYIEESSIRSLEGDNLENLMHSELLRGDDSFGTLLDDKGFPSVPSFTDPFPNEGESYFSGGYNTVRHGSRDNVGSIDAIQIELNQDVRFISVNREALIDSLADVTNEYLNIHFNDQYFGNFCNLILPVELLTFTVEKRNQEVILNWQSLTETNNDYFEIQRRINGAPFETIGRLDGQGNSTEPEYYQFIDKPDKGLIYYRLKQIDFDGEVAYSETRQVEFWDLPEQDFMFYPNPSSAKDIHLWYYVSQGEELDFSIYDVSGRLILRQSRFVEPGNNRLKLDFSILTSGVYFVKIGTKYQQTQQKLIIK